MNSLKRVALVAALAVSAMLAAAGSASAYTGLVAPAGGFSLVSSGYVTFEASGLNIECYVTLDGTLSAAISNVERLGSHAGEIDGVEWSNCRGGTVRAVLWLEWPMVTRLVWGTLPNAATDIDFDIRFAEIELAVFGGFVNCLYGGNFWISTELSGSNPYRFGLTSIVGASLSRVSGALCPIFLNVRGTFTVSPTQRMAIE